MNPYRHMAPQPVMMLVNSPIKDLLLQMNTEPINVNSNDTNFEAHQKTKHIHTDSDIQKDSSLFFCKGYSRSAVRWGPWTYGMMVKANSSDHRGHSYTIQVMKMRRLITWGKETHI